MVTASLRLLGILGLCGLLVTLAPIGQVHAGGTTTSFVVVASGLDHPKGLAFAPSGDLYVAESGHSDGTCPPPTDTKPVTSVGMSGAVAKISVGGTVSTVASGLPSSCAEGDFIGPSDVAFVGSNLYILQGGCIPQAPPAVPCSTSNPLLAMQPDGAPAPVAQFFSKNNGQVPNEPEEDPYAIARGPDGNFYVADGGNNSIWKLAPPGASSGTVKTISKWLVQFPKDPVPTGLAISKAGFIYVSLFTGAPFLQGAGKVERVFGDGRTQDLVTGLTTPIDVAFSPAGTLYILQYSSQFALQPFPHFLPNTGEVWRLTSSGALEPVITGLNFPTSMAFGPNGNLYIANNGTSPAPTATGQVVMAFVGS